MRLILSCLACALLLLLSASSLIAAGQTGNLYPGFTLSEVATHLPNNGSNGYDVNANSLVADPRDNEAVFYFDGDEIRRYDFADSTDSAVFDVPAIASADAPGSLSNIQDLQAMTGEVWGGFLRFDPANPDRMVFGESSTRAVHEYFLSSTDRNLVTASSTIYQTAMGDDWSPFDATFLASGELLISRGGTDNGNSVNRLTVVDSSTTPSTLTDIAQIAGFSGPCSVDNDGTLYYLVPQNTAGLTTATQLRLLSWTSQQVADALADSVANELTNANAVTERNDDHAAWTFTTQILARGEDAGTKRIVYSVTYSGGVTRWDLDDPQEDLLIVGAANFSSFSGVAFSSPTALVEPDVGANHNGEATARVFVLTSIFNAFNDQPSCIARIAPDAPLDEVNTVMTGLSAQPSVAQTYDGGAGSTFTLEVTLRDEAGEVVRYGTAANATYAIEAFVNNNGVAGAGAAFAAGSLSVQANEGVITFSGMALADAGSYILRVRDLTSTVILDTPFEVNTIDSIVHISTIPATPVADQAFSLSIELRDQNGARIVTGDLASAIVSLTNVSGPGALTGTNFAQASNGVATFSDLRLTSGNFVLSFASDGGTAQAGTLIEVPVSVRAAQVGGGNANIAGASSSSGCVLASQGSQWPLVLLILGLMGVLVARRRVA